MELPPIEDEHGSLAVEVQADFVEWTFIPRSDRLAPRPISPQPELLCRFNVASKQLLIWPLVPFPDNDRYTQPKYSKIRTIRVDLPYVDPEIEDISDLASLTEHLPSSFVKRWKFGLGIRRRYEPVISTIEGFSEMPEIYLSEDSETRVLDSAFQLSKRDLEGICAELRRVDDRASTAAMRFKRTFVHNSFAALFSAPTRVFKRGRHPMIKLLSDEVSNVPFLTDAEQDLLISKTIVHAPQLAREKPNALATLRRDLDLANLDQLIQTFRSDLSKNLTENHWQRFFQENPFALHLAFGCPLVQVQGQASVGGMKLSGKDGRIADFLAKNAITGNIALFEIKRPSSRLLNRTLYRNTIYTPSIDLTGAVGQVLDQKVELTKSLASIKESSGQYDLQAYSIQCCVLIGKTPEEANEVKALETYRGNSSMVDIVTYDELLLKLEQLRGLLSESSD